LKSQVSANICKAPVGADHYDDIYVQMLGRNMPLKIFLYNVTLIRQKNLKNKVKFKNKYVQLGQSPEFLYTEIIIFIWIINA
jgi:hypothetical protein